MGTITSGVGLLSGLDYQNIVDQLMKIEARPRDLVQARIGALDAQKTAFLDISARITALLSRINLLTQTSSFQATTAKSSLPDVLSATAGAGAQPGTYQFVVRALAARHQAVSRGFADRTATLPPGTLTIESAQARVDRSTRLEELNGHAGVQRGAFKITNAAGQSATINIADTLTVGEVIEKINAAGLSVQASIREDGLVLRDTSGGTGTLRIQEVGGGKAAAGLGFGPGHMYDSDHDGELAGSSVMYLAAGTSLAALNDGLGVRHSAAGGDFTIGVGQSTITVDVSDIIKPETRLERLNHGQGVRLGRLRITSKDGTQAEVDLSGAKTIGDVKTALQGAFGGARINVSLADGHLIVSDNTPNGTSPLVIEDVTGFAARDLGINGKTDGKQITGRDVVHMDTLADVLGAVNFAVGNQDAGGNPLVVASIAADGHGLLLENRSAGGGPLTLAVPPGSTSQALLDLGFQPGTYNDPGGGARVAGGRIIGGIDTVLLKTLNGGAGFAGGTIRIAAGTKTADVDLSSAATLADVVKLVNQAAQNGTMGIEASYDATGTRLTIANLDGGDTPITISDVVGNFAASTGLAQTSSSIRSNNLQRQYIAGTTKLVDLSDGRGVSYGSFTITNSTGASKTVTLTAGSDTTVQNVIDAINGTDIGVQARINDTGDGLLIVDTTAGAGPLKIEEKGGTTAHDLNILSTSTQKRIDGSFEFKLQVGGSDTLEGMAARIGTETTLAQASVLSNGTPIAPYRLSITSRVSGARGELIIDDSGTDFGITTLTRPQDARILFGGNADGGILLTSPDNTFNGVVDGLTITAGSVDDHAVTVTVDRNLQTLTDTMKGLVTDYNSLMGRIKEISGYDKDKQQGGILLGDGTLQTIESRLFRMFTRSVAEQGSTLKRLSQVGLKFDSGSQLSFDEDKFQAAYNADPEAVTRFFTDKDHGIAPAIKAQIDAITDTGGLINRQTGTLDDQKKLLQSRVDQLNELLDRKRARLLSQFQAMEQALAQLQSQQNALSGLASTTQNFTNMFNTSKGG